MFYHFGVAECLQRHNLAMEPSSFAGSSAGALAAAKLALHTRVDFEKVKVLGLSCAEQVHGRILPAFRLHNLVSRILDISLPKCAGPPISKGRLRVVCSSFSIVAKQRL